MAEYLLEIGLEEMPAGPIPNVVKTLKENAITIFKDERLKFETIDCYATPRRIVLQVIGLDERQEDLIEEIKGPSVKAAYQDGKIAKPLLGFLKANNFSESDIYTKELNNGEYIFCKREEKGTKTYHVLEKIIPELILGLRFPKNMKWGSHELRYIRPIRWIVSLLDEQIISFTIENISSSNVSRGHRTLGHQYVEISSTKTYFETMKKEFVIVDQEERKKIILDQINNIFKDSDEFYQEDDNLLQEIIYLIEYPTVLKGTFDQEFLKLPKELIITPMKEHQRYFPVLNKNGDLMNAFITVRNGNKNYLDMVTQGNENVLRARLADAEFFYKEDLKKGLESGEEKIKDIVFQEKLGTIYDKVTRLKAVVASISHHLKLNDLIKENSKTVVKYMKLDLVSNVVSEFPELQGIMGEYYFNAQYSGKKNIAQAIREHYLPRFANDLLPATIEGGIVSIADKFDTIVGCHYAGIIPTGSKDPYALRRQALGIVNIILNNRWSLSLKECIENICQSYQKTGHIFNNLEINEKIYQFFEQRLVTVMKEMSFSPDIIQSVLKSGYDNPYETILRAKALKDFLNQNDISLAKQTLDNLGRATNIIGKTKINSVDKELFSSEYEEKFYDAIVCAEKQISHLLDDMNFEKIFNVMTTLNKVVEEFFDNVLVMDENISLQNNRLALVAMYVELLNAHYHLNECKIN